MTTADWAVVAALFLLAYAIKREWDNPIEMGAKYRALTLGEAGVSIAECGVGYVIIDVRPAFKVAGWAAGEMLLLQNASVVGGNKYKITGIEYVHGSHAVVSAEAL